jgi:hypothetical protein
MEIAQVVLPALPHVVPRVGQVALHFLQAYSHVLASPQVVSAVPALVSVTQVALHGLTLACRPSHGSPLICRLFCGFIIIARRFLHGSSIRIYVKSKVESTYSSILRCRHWRHFS